MEILSKIQEKRAVLAAALTLVIIGFSLMFFTWQVLEQQKEAVEKHLLLSAASVFETVESVLRRGHMEKGSRDVGEQVEDIFREFEENADVAFVGILGPFSSDVVAAAGDRNESLRLPPGVLRKLRENEEWHGTLNNQRHGLFVYGRRIFLRTSRIRPPMPQDLARPDTFSPGALLPDPKAQEDTSRAQDRRMRRMMRQNLPLLTEPPVFLIVALDMTKHRNVYTWFRQGAILQGAYIMVAALFIWIISSKFIARRELAGKAAGLERFQASLLDNMPDGLLTFDSAGVIYAANPAAHEMLGVPQGSLVGGNAHDLPEPQRDFFRALSVNGTVNQARQSAHYFFANISMPLGQVRRQLNFSGARLEVLHTSFQDSSDTFSHMLIIRDRTNEHNLEKSLAEAEKLAAVGTLAAGVAHEIRNPLSALRGFAQYFAKKLAGHKPEESYAQTMVKEADRLNRVITDLLDLSHPKKPEISLLELEPIIADMRSLLQLDFNEHSVELRVDLACPCLWGDEKALKQSLINLLLNSLDALDLQPDSCDRPKTIWISSVAANADLPLSSTESGMETDFTYAKSGVWLEVKDNGPGMSVEQAKQSVEPFFTTKDKGTGLGLALVHKTMREHGGQCEVIAVPDTPSGSGGVRVRLFFPDYPEGRNIAYQESDGVNE